MKDFNDMRLQERLGELVFEYIGKGNELVGEDDGYSAYIGFSVLGSLLLKSLGSEKFDEIVQEIKDKQ